MYCLQAQILSKTNFNSSELLLSSTVLSCSDYDLLYPCFLRCSILSTSFVWAMYFSLILKDLLKFSLIATIDRDNQMIGYLPSKRSFTTLFICLRYCSSSWRYSFNKPANYKFRRKKEIALSILRLIWVGFNFGNVQSSSSVRSIGVDRQTGGAGE